MIRWMLPLLTLVLLVSTGEKNPLAAQNRPGMKANMAQIVAYEITVKEDVHVRMLNPPVEFDDKGKPKKRTAAELKSLKGDEPAEQKLPGIKSAYDVLKPGDTVKVSMLKPRDPKKLEKTTWSDAGQLLGRVSSVESGEAKTIVIVVSPNGTLPPMGPGGKGRPRGAAPANTTAIPPTKAQVSMIVIVEQAPDQPAKPEKKKKTAN